VQFGVKPKNGQAHKTAQGIRQMKTRRWMKTVLVEASKDQIEMPWARSKRAKRRAAKPAPIKAAV
jgi:hypothetical protein